MTDDGYFGAEVAAAYDAPDGMFAPEVVTPAVDVLARLAGSGRALELAIGTGRLALPLAARGVEVHGIELSRSMVAELRRKPGGATFPVTIGDMATTVVEGSFALVYLVFNTIMNLTTQEAQGACFRNAAAHLEPGGVFLVETMVPDLRLLPPGQSVVPFRADADGYGLDVYDIVHQGLVSHHIDLRGDGTAQARSIPFRYVWPSELDLMAQLAGMRSRDRWADWAGSPFTAESRSHVSTWERPHA